MPLDDDINKSSRQLPQPQTPETIESTDYRARKKPKPTSVHVAAHLSWIASITLGALIWRCQKEVTKNP
jgi:hypothetical protein